MSLEEKITKPKKVCLQKEGGFTLVETLLAMLLFALIVVMVSGTFVAFLKNYATIRNAQRSTESAQFAMNLMAKTIRTSQVLDTGESIAQNQIFLFDFSQKRCLRYRINGGTVTVSYSENAVPPNSIANCIFDEAQLTAAAEAITAPEVVMNGSFTVAPPISATQGFVRIVLSAAEGNQVAPPTWMQTSVSLRNPGTNSTTPLIAE